MLYGGIQNCAIASVRNMPNFNADIVILSWSKYLKYNQILKELKADEATLSAVLPRYTIFVID